MIRTTNFACDIFQMTSENREVESTRQTLQMAMSIGKSARLYVAYAQFLSYCNEVIISPFR
jgi:hypothetical protein